MKSLIFALTTIALLVVLNKLAGHYYDDTALFSPGYLLIGIPICLVFAAFYCWLFRPPRD